MRVLLTGASGFVGRIIAEQLLLNGSYVLAIGRRAPRLSDSSLDFLRADLSDRGALDFLRSTAKFDAIVHGAAAVSGSMLDTEVTLVNTFGTHQLVNAAVNHSIPRFVYLSGVSVIGGPGAAPITESTQISPNSVYQASKAYGEFLVDRCFGAHGLSTTLRITAPVGKGMPEGRFLSALVRSAKLNRPLQIYGQGSRRQNYVDVRDVSLAVSLALQSECSGVFNIGGSCSISNVELATAVIRELQSQSEIQYTGQQDPEDGQSWIVSIDKAKRHLGYCPLYDINASIHTVAGENKLFPASD